MSLLLKLKEYFKKDEQEMSTSFYKLKTVRVQKDTEEAIDIALAIPEKLKDTFKYTQGQYISFRIFVDGKEERRSYSIINAPGENADEIEVLVKILEGGKVSTEFNQNLKTGDEVEVMPPMGNFHTNFHPANERVYVGLAAGSGISPVLSNIKEALLEEPKSKVYLFYGNRTKSHILKKSTIDKMQKQFGDRLKVNYLLSREKPENPVFGGRITNQKLDQLFEMFKEIPIQQAIYFICGPTEMIKGISEYLRSMKKVPTLQVLHEYYTSPDGVDDPSKSDDFKKIPDINSMVTVILDDDEYSFELNSKAAVIVDKANDEGIPAPYSCHGGVCCTCMAKLEEGEVYMEKNYALSEDQVKQGFILTCQSHPITPTVTVNYDV